MDDSDLSAREWREKYQALLAENGRLREEIRQLKALLRDESLPAPASVLQNTQDAETIRVARQGNSLFRRWSTTARRGRQDRAFSFPLQGAGRRVCQTVGKQTKGDLRLFALLYK